MPEDAIEVRAIVKRFGTGAAGVTAVDGVSLAVRQNEFFTLLGPSGCGKTTLLRLIAGFEQPTSGDILLEGRSVAGLPPFRRAVNTVFQSYALFPHLTVGQNVAFGLEMTGRPAAERRDRVAGMLRLVRLEGYQDRRPAALSGGQQQRVALARALAPGPRVLLLDEPLSALDLKLRKEMQVELKRLQGETGITFIFVTHDQEEALTMSDRLAVMKDGAVLQVGTPTEIYERPATRFVAGFIGETNFLEGAVERDGQAAALRLDDGTRLALAGPVSASGRVTAAVRPERAGLSPGRPESGAVAGRVDDAVYFGTDTIYRLALSGGGRFEVRVQNRDGAGGALAPGSEVAVLIPPDAIRILGD